MYMIKEIELPEDPQRKKREQGKKNPCLICGREVDVNKKTTAWVHMNTSWKAVNTDDESKVDSQGCFPIGPECKKKLPKEFIL